MRERIIIALKPDGGRDLRAAVNINPLLAIHTHYFHVSVSLVRHDIWAQRGLPIGVPLGRREVPS